MATDLPMSPELEQIDGEIHDIFRALQNGFQKMDKIKDSNRQAKQLEGLTGKMKECKRLIKEFDRILKDEESNNPPEINKQLNDRKQFMVDQRVEFLCHLEENVVAQTVETGAQTAATLTQQTEQMKRIGNELDSVHFSLKKASQLVKEIGRQVATDKCIMAFLFLIVLGVIAIIVVKIVHPNNKNIRDIPGLAPPAQNYQINNRRLLWTEAFIGV
ncbi:putative plant SNARE 13-like [Panicum miliaceum]|uniref:Plant SNARE 13-like n=1 Tax=Panicum miliaceum TaxID=4540 RepID=A0A3L6TQF1_PANMI|nr:putative plant SNARE 13-like [Panicum miliaceum]